MSEEKNASGNAPSKPASAEKSAEEPAKIVPGKFGALLEKAGFPVEHLGADAQGVEMIALPPTEQLLEAAEYLRDNGDCRFDLALSCAAMDWKEYRESVYHLYGTTTHEYLAIKVRADENDHSPSLYPVWAALDWHERESYDLMGIHYDGHPNLVRILMPVDWLGHPLRKDYRVDDPRLVWNER